MKDWIKQHLKESLDEISTKSKPIYGKGAYHNVYTSKKNPDRLYKIGDEDTVYEWLSTFKDYPQYFPKVYRAFPYKKDPTLTVVEIEKLNTVKAAEELALIDRFLINASDVIYCKNVSILNFFDKECIEDVMEAAENSEAPYLPQIIFKWGKFLKAVTPIIEKDLGRPLDLHVGNVAYDKMGKLKLIDI